MQLSQFSQQKLSAKEWQSIEIPLSSFEKEIAELIEHGFADPLVRFNKTPTIHSFTKMNSNEEIEKKLFLDLFALSTATLVKTLTKFIARDRKSKKSVLTTNLVAAIELFIGQTENLVKSASQVSKQKNKPKKADLIRVGNAVENLTTNKSSILEFLLFEQIEFLMEAICSLDTKSSAKALYTLTHMGKNTLLQRNVWIQSMVDFSIMAGKESLGGELETAKIVLKNAASIIEANQDISRCVDKQLYEHQKQLFSTFHSPGPKLVFYSAATGTGKTLSPLGLSVNFKIIFVCAARHVGLSLGRSSIALNKAVAFGFGCESSADIRLHYFAAKEYTRNSKTGGIRKVDNSVGDRVDIMICDIKSYEYAMLYMLAFNSMENIITYWDEPTISLDHEDHELHEKIQNLWSVNKISQVVFSSATLPEPNEVSSVISDFKESFPGAEIFSITSQEENKSVSIISKSGIKITPHTIFGGCGLESGYLTFQECLVHCAKNPILLKFFDIGELAKVLIAAIDGRFLPFLQPQWEIEIDLSLISVVENLSIRNIKHFYLKFLQQIACDKWAACVDECIRPMLIARIEGVREAANPDIFFTTKDANSLKHGPSIFIVENVHTIAQFLIQESQIPAEKLEKVQELIDNNDKNRQLYDKLRRNLEDLMAEDLGKERKMAKETVRLSPAANAINLQLEAISAELKEVTLDKRFVPNSKSHQNIWAPGGVFDANAFTTHLDAASIEMVMNLSNIDTSWKILLLMGIGIFPKEEVSDEEPITTEYLEVMKLFATEQKLFLIIAASDYIFGLNYNLCHGILGRDLKLTQQKAIQAAGRVGRFGNEKYTLRLRDDAIINTLFLPQETNLEASNFCKLFVKI